MTEGVVLELDDADSYLKLLREGDSQPRVAFLRSFHHRLGPIARQLAKTHRALARLAVISRDERHGTVHLMLHAGFNSVFSSLLLLIEGYPLAAGHLMRHYAEASAMALLILDDDPNVWNAFDRDRTKYPVHKATHRLLQTNTAGRLRRLLGFDVDAWRRFLAIERFYEGFSHATAFSLGFHIMVDRPGVNILGPEFDPGKRKQLSIELRRRRSALRPLTDLVRATHRVVSERLRRGGLTRA